MRLTAAVRASARDPLLHVAKTALATIVAWIVCDLVIPDGPPPVFGAIAAMLVVQPSLNQSLTKGVERSVGVVAVPSRRRPQLVGSLAERLSTIGRLPLLGTLDLVDGGPVGEPGGNSAFRLAGVWDRLAVGPELGGRLEGLSGPVLLVDDLVDSGKTVIVIEHHQAVMAHADWIIDLGPGAGHDGGRIVFEGTPADIVADRSTLTGEHLASYVAG